MQIQKQQLKGLPFHELAHLSVKDLDQAVAELNLKPLETWLPHQILAYYGGWHLVFRDGLVDIRSTLQKNVGSETWSLGLLRLVKDAARSKWISKQTDPSGAAFSALVPIVLAGAKLYHGVRYESWRAAGLEWVVGDQLYQAMTTPRAAIAREELLQLRSRGLQQRGTERSPTSASRLYGLAGTSLGSMPVLQQTQVTQTWVAHPAVRHPLAVLDSENWDSMPEPLIDTEPLAQPSQTQTPWMN